MQKRVQCHKLATTPHSRVISACLNPTSSVSRVCGSLGNRQRLNFHHTQASQEKPGRELLSIDLSIDLVRRFIDAQHFQAIREFSVGDFFPPHLYSQDFPCTFFPFTPYFGRWFLVQLNGVECHIGSDLFEHSGFVFNKSVFYDRKLIITSSRFLYESINHLFRSRVCGIKLNL